MTRPKIFGIAGWKNSGKTGLAVRLVTELVARGYRVSTIKHAHHDFALFLDIGQHIGLRRTPGQRQHRRRSPHTRLLHGNPFSGRPTAALMEGILGL